MEGEDESSELWRLSVLVFEVKFSDRSMLALPTERQKVQIDKIEACGHIFCQYKHN